MSYSSTILADNPTAYYKLNETNGTTATDSSGNGFDGTLNGTITLNQAALAAGLDSCMLFNGSSGFISIPTGVNIVPPLSVELWMTDNSIAANGMWYSANTTLGFEYGWHQAASNKILVGGHGGSFDSTPALVSGSKYYVCLTIDGSSNFTIFAAKVGTDSAPSNWGTGNPGGGPTYSGNARIGCATDGSSFFKGYISEVAVYPVALSTTQMNTHYTAGITAPAVTGPKPRYITRGLLSTIIPDVVTQPLPYIDRGIGSTIVYENRTFIPRALGGVYIPDTVLWVPRAFGGTISQALATTTTYAFTDGLIASDGLLVAENALPLDSLSASDSTLSTDGTIPLDSLSASDIGNLQGWGVDGLTATDSLLETGSALPVDALSASDALLGQDGSLYTEATSASDALTGTDAGLLIESLALSDSLLEQGGYLPTDALSGSESLLTASASTYVETNSASESLVGAESAVWTEANSASDSLSGGGGGSTGLLIDTLATSDTLFVTDTGLSTDALTITDLGGTLFSWPLDALSATDSLLNGNGSLLLDGGTGAAEADLNTDSSLFVDALVADDSASTMDQSSPSLLTTTYSFTDALVASDSLLKTESALPIEANSASDSLGGGGTGSILAESLATSDSLLETATSIYTEANSTSDALLGGRTSIYTEANSASDTLLGGSTGSLAESLATSDSLLETETMLAVEGIPASDLSGSLFRWSVDSLSATGSILGTDVSLPLNGLSGSETDLATTSYQGLDDALLATDSVSISQTSSTVYTFTELYAVTETLFLTCGGNALDGLSTSTSMLETQSVLIVADVPFSPDTVLAIENAIPLDALSATTALLSTFFTPQHGPNAPAPVLSAYTITNFFPQEMVLTPVPAPKGPSLIGVGPGVGQPADTVGGTRN